VKYPCPQHTKRKPPTSSFPSKNGTTKMSNGTTTCPEGTRGYAEANPGNCVWYQSPIPVFDQYLAAPCCSVITGKLSVPPIASSSSCHLVFNTNPCTHRRRGSTKRYRKLLPKMPVTSANVNQTLACLNSTFHIAQIAPAADIACYYIPAKSQGSILRAGNIMVVLLPLMGFFLAFASGNVL
jgi:hypothetical protein